MKQKCRDKKGPTPKQNKYNNALFAISQLFKEKKAWLKGSMHIEIERRKHEKED